MTAAKAYSIPCSLGRNEMHLLKSLATFAAFATCTMAAEEAPVAPKMTLLYSMEALLGERFSLGPIPTGNERIVIPIVGGTFKGPRLNGMFTLSTNSCRLLHKYLAS